MADWIVLHDRIISDELDSVLGVLHIKYGENWDRCWGQKLSATQRKQHGAIMQEQELDRQNNEVKERS